MNYSKENCSTIFKRCIYGHFWQVCGVRIPLPGLLTPGTTFLCHRSNSADQFDIRIEIGHPLFGTTFTQAGVFRGVAT